MKKPANKFSRTLSFGFDVAPVFDDKFEVQRLYKIYHKDLGGNGRGTRYYEIIMKLPDAPA